MSDETATNGPDEIVTVLLPEDEYPHEPDDAVNYNESMYLNAFDLGRQAGGWFRLGNRVNEGYAEMSVCIYLPDGRVGFMFDRPKITTNAEMKAGGLRIDVHEPFEHLSVHYEGKVCLLDDPSEMANPREAFANNPRVPATVDIDWYGVSPMYGGKPVYADGCELEVQQAAEKSFAKAHYEQHMADDGLHRRSATRGPRAGRASGCATSPGVPGTGRRSRGTGGCPSCSTRTSP